MDPVSISASILALVDWKKVLQSLATDAAGKSAKGLLGRLKRDEREKAARRVLKYFADEFLGEVEDKSPLSSAVPGYSDQLNASLNMPHPRLQIGCSPIPRKSI